MLHGGLHADAYSLSRHFLPQIFRQHLTIAHNGADQASRLCIQSINKEFGVKVSDTYGSATLSTAYGAIVDESGSHRW